MTFEKTYEVQQDSQLIIELPDQFKSKKVRVTIEDIDDSRDEKIKMLKKSCNDPLFLADIKEAMIDFENSDKEW